MNKQEIIDMIKVNQKRDTLLCSELNCKDCPVREACWSIGGNANDLLVEWLRKNDIAIKLDLI
jgi:hypothetical protein